MHNAGAIRAALLGAVDVADLQALTQLHLGAAIDLTQAFLPGMKAARFGRIVLISSRAALGLQTRTSYSATKAGLIGMARTWALELGPSGITVNVVAPGPIADTEMFESVMRAGVRARAEARARRSRSGGWGAPRTWRAPSISSSRRKPISSPGRRFTSAAARASARSVCNEGRGAMRIFWQSFVDEAGERALSRAPRGLSQAKSRRRA